MVMIGVMVSHNMSEVCALGLTITIRKKQNSLNFSLIIFQTYLNPQRKLLEIMIYDKNNNNDKVRIDEMLRKMIFYFLFKLFLWIRWVQEP